jgi:hypothetical protein
LSRVDAPRGAEQSTPRRQAGGEGVVVLDGGQPISAGELVVTSAPRIDDTRFRPEVAREINSKYYGYLIATKKEAGRFRFDGPARAFTAKYGTPVTIDWPDATEFVYRDSRANAASLSAVLSDAPLPEIDNFRIYYFPLRVGFDGAGYQIEDTLTVVMLDPATGVRQAFTVRQQSGRVGIYPLDVAGVPSGPYEASVVTVLGVATTDEIDVPIGPRLLKMTVHVKVPRHTFAAATYRSSGGRRDPGSRLSLGPALELPVGGGELLRRTFDEAVEAQRTGAPISSSSFGQTCALLDAARRAMSESIARRPRAPGGRDTVR